MMAEIIVERRGLCFVADEREETHAIEPARVQALARLSERPDVALLLTDVVMPGMSGRELSDTALERRPLLKTLYTTGYTRNAIVHGGVLDPGIDLIQKPFTADQLARKVRSVLDAPAGHLRRELRCHLMIEATCLDRHAIQLSRPC